MELRRARSPAGPGPFGAPFPIVYVDGEFVDERDARLSLHANVISYGTGTFEGMRAFYNEDHGELYLLEATRHYARLRESANVLQLDPPPDADELTAVTGELLRRNEVRCNAYVRPLYVLADDGLPVKIHGYKARLSIAATPVTGDYVSLDGLRCKVSSWRRAPDVVLPGRAKICGSYVTNALAKTEAVGAGYDEAIMLTVDGLVAEGTTSNVFMRRGSTWITPPATDDILEGVTRAQVMTLLHERTGHPVLERSIHRSELHVCEELFLCGTAALVAPVVAVDDRPIDGGKPGETSIQLLHDLRAIADRSLDSHPEWTTPVYADGRKRA